VPVYRSRPHHDESRQGRSSTWSWFRAALVESVAWSKSQPTFASSLGVSPETYRAWDPGRRTVPGTWLEKARALAVINDSDRLRSLQDLATELRVHVRTLRNAARSGRLEVENRVVFRNPINS
jgi:hypothetical protein